MKKYLFTVRNYGQNEKHLICTKKESETFDFAKNNGEVKIIEQAEDKITFMHNGVLKSLNN